MKKGKAIAILAIILVTSICYMGYAWRHYYTKPNIHFCAGMPPEKQQVIQDWFNSYDKFEYPQFDLSEALKSLPHPHQRGGPKVSVHHWPNIGYMLFVERECLAVFTDHDGVFKHESIR